VNDGLDNLLKTAARLGQSGCQGIGVDAWLFDRPEALPTLAEAMRGSAVVQAMTFDSADSRPSRSAAAVMLVPAE
jgi:hypothetical protein